MNYKIVVFGVKDTSEMIIDYIMNNLMSIDLVVSISEEVTKKNDVSGYKGLDNIVQKYSIEIYKSESYSLNDQRTVDFFENNTFEIGICMGWQRLIPKYVLERFKYGVFGFHGSCGYLPYGRGRSPLNWTIINGDTRFNLNLFRYDENADSPNIFGTEMFSITLHDNIRTAQYKNMICAKRLVEKLLSAYKSGCIEIKKDFKDYASWFSKRTPEDGKIDFREKTRSIYNLVRGVTEPFPGAFAYVMGHKVKIWELYPFDEMIDFSMYEPGEIIDIYDKRLIVRTVDGSLIISKYDSDIELSIGDIFK